MYSQKSCYLSFRQQISWECWFRDAKLTCSIEFLQIYRTVERKIASRMLQKTDGVTNNIKTNTSPGGLADHHSRQPKLLKNFYVIVFWFWYTSMFSPSFELIFAFLLVQFLIVAIISLQLFILECKTRFALLLRPCLDGAD